MSSKQTGRWSDGDVEEWTGMDVSSISGGRGRGCVADFAWFCLVQKITAAATAAAAAAGSGLIRLIVVSCTVTCGLHAVNGWYKRMMSLLEEYRQAT